MGRLLIVLGALVALSACESGREMSCECSGDDVLEGEHPADAEYGTCSQLDYTCWTLAGEESEECTVAHEAEEQESVCCEGDDCSCSCEDMGKATTG